MNGMLATPIGRVRLVGLLEGVSFVLLLFVAMPLKYLFGRPEAVHVVGLAHGVLFILYLAVWFQAVVLVRWPRKRAIQVLGCALVPFGPFFIDRSLAREDVDSPLSE